MSALLWTVKLQNHSRSDALFRAMDKKHEQEQLGSMVQVSMWHCLYPDENLLWAALPGNIDYTW